jgi:AraC-like DNA-binding protein
VDLILEKRGGRALPLKIVGTMTKAQSFELSSDQRTIGVRFHPAMAARFLKIPIADVVDQSLDLGNFWGDARTRTLCNLLSEPCSIDRCISVFEEILGSPPDLDPVEKAIAALVECRGRASVKELADAASLSPRHFRRICLERTGVTAKRLSRILRFRHAAGISSDGPRLGWADLAIECGYYDQAHLINEFREFSGLPPGEFAASAPQPA